MIVAKVQTKYQRSAVVNALKEAWREMREREPSIYILALLYAQYAFETGHGEYCWNNNLGNHRADIVKEPEYLRSATKNCFELPQADEYINGKRVIVGGYFRSYSEPFLGAIGHLELLMRQSSYKLAWRHLLDLEGVVELDSSSAIRIFKEFVYLLKLGGYFTGNADTYAAGVSSIALSVVQEFMRAIAPTLSPPITAPETPEAIRITPDPWIHGAISVETALNIIDEGWSIDKTHEFLACRFDCPKAA